MRMREKEKETYNAVKNEIKRLEKELADLIVNDAFAHDSLSLNTKSMQQKVGRLKALREIFFP